MLCRKTVRALESIEEIPIQLLNNAQSDLIANSSDRPPIEFKDEFFGENALDFNTCLYIAEQLFRFQTCTTTLAHLVGGPFGQLMSRMMVGASTKNKRKSKAEDKFVHKRTSFEIGRSLYDEIDVIHETAQCTLFGAMDKMRLLVPLYMGETVEKGSIRWTLGEDKKAERDEDGNRINKNDVYTLWRDFYAFCPITGEEVRCAAMMDNVELDLIQTIIAHNQECGPANWQFFVANAKNSDTVNDLFGIAKEDVETGVAKGIVVVRRVYSTLRRAITNCILAAFGSSAVRFFILEYGHNTERMHYIEEHREDRRLRYNNPDMIPLQVMEDFEKAMDDIDKTIIGVSSSCNSPKEVFEELQVTMETPISQATFYRRWAKLQKLAEELVMDLT